MKGVKSIDKGDYTIDVHYDYYYDSGDWEQPPCEELEIEKVELNGHDITNFYFDYVDIDDEIDEKCLDHARENNN